MRGLALVAVTGLGAALAAALRRRACGGAAAASNSDAMRRNDSFSGRIDAAAAAIVEAAEAGATARIHIVGSSVNLPDMSATLNAKVAVSDAEQQDPRLLARVYDDMASKFSEHGLNLAAVEAMRQYFAIAPGQEEEAEPLAYDAFPSPLPPRSVRLCVLFFQLSSPALARLVHKAACEVMAALPPGFTHHLNKPSHYHITVYMTSQPHTLRPDPFDPASAANAPEAALAAGPSPGTLLKEVEAMRAAAAAIPAPSFEVHRLVLADSGTLLLCWVDASGQVARLRQRLRHAFPGGPPKQSTIMHASIARLLAPRQLGREDVARLQAICDRWTERLRGMRFDPEALFHICEQTFTTVEGPRIPLPFARPGSARGSSGRLMPA